MPDTQPRRFQCRHIFTDGHRCGSPCLRGEEFCFYHPVSASGGHSRPVAHQPPRPQRHTGARCRAVASPRNSNSASRHPARAGRGTSPYLPLSMKDFRTCSTGEVYPAPDIPHQRRAPPQHIDPRGRPTLAGP